MGTLHVNLCTLMTMLAVNIIVVGFVTRVASFGWLLWLSCYHDYDSYKLCYGYVNAPEVFHSVDVFQLVHLFIHSFCSLS